MSFFDLEHDAVSVGGPTTGPRSDRSPRSERQALSPLSLINTKKQVPHDGQRDQAKDTKRAIEQPPRQRDSADRTTYQRQRNDQQTGNHAELNYPNVPNWVPQRSDESDGDHNMSERQPVSPIGEKGIITSSGFQPLADISEPTGQSGKHVSDRRARAKPRCEELQLPREGKRGKSAQHQPYNEQGQQEARIPQALWTTQAASCHQGILHSIRLPRL
jgi:hypothetical protein